MMGRLTALVLVVGGVGCATTGGADEERMATVDLRNAAGESVGMATLVEQNGELEISVHVTDLPPGIHGIHLHEVGQCTPPDFSSAGGHFSPEGRSHGFEDPQGPHAGDLRNIQVGADGSGHFVLENDRVTLSPGPNALLDADGSALVVHAGADDYRTDPAGDSGPRIACGVITRA